MNLYSQAIDFVWYYVISLTALFASNLRFKLIEFSLQTHWIQAANKKGLCVKTCNLLT
jgi:hypothetical protein